MNAWSLSAPVFYGEEWTERGGGKFYIIKEIITKQS